MNGPVVDGPVIDGPVVHGPVGVVGAGTMGAGIAQVAAVAGRRVLIADAVPGAAAARAVAAVRDRVKAQVAKGRLSVDPGRPRPHRRGVGRRTGLACAGRHRGGRRGPRRSSWACCSPSLRIARRRGRHPRLQHLLAVAHRAGRFYHQPQAPGRPALLQPCSCHAAGGGHLRPGPPRLEVAAAAAGNGRRVGQDRWCGPPPPPGSSSTGSPGPSTPRHGGWTRSTPPFRSTSTRC